MNYCLGMDLGEKSLGLAININNCIILLNTIYYPKNNFKNLLSQLETIFEKYEIKKVAIGIPVMENITLKISKMVKYFSKLLENKFNVKVYFINENFTTKAAKNMFIESTGIKNQKTFNKIKDSLAAKLILETFLKNSRSLN